MNINTDRNLSLDAILRAVDCHLSNTNPPFRSFAPPLKKAAVNQ